MDNLETWDKLKQPPKEALRQIQGGRLKGKTDINPQWRYKAMTETFGMCGVGWKYTIEQLSSEEGANGELLAFATINLWVKQGEKKIWSEPIPGTGGSMLITKESSGLHSSDEGYKMAITDALSVAMKMLGVGADFYAGLWDGSKYTNNKPEVKAQEPKKQEQVKAKVEVASKKDTVRALAKECGWLDKLEDGVTKWTAYLVTLGKKNFNDLTQGEVDKAIEVLKEEKEHREATLKTVQEVAPDAKLL